MIQGFFNVIQKDLCCISRAVFKPLEEEKGEEQRVKSAAIRIFAALGMAYSLMLAISAFQAATAFGGIFLLASAVALYAISHDVFVIKINEDKGVVDQMKAIGQSVFSDLKDLFDGTKSLEDISRHPLTEGTFFRSLWDTMLPHFYAT